MNTSPGTSIQLHDNAATLPDPRTAAPAALGGTSTGAAILISSERDQNGRSLRGRPPTRGVIMVRRNGGNITTLTGPVRLVAYINPHWEGALSNGQPDVTPDDEYGWYSQAVLVEENGAADLSVPFTRLVEVDPGAARLALVGTPTHAVDVFFRRLLDE